ncbi:MAG TPA: hypothetical protein VHB48_03445 [Chitinophagaceae bacterium]|nr:hypothetical protein [Chitinophagaceae bacterium]
MQPSFIKALLLLIFNVICLAGFSQASFIESLKPAANGFYTGRLSNGNVVLMGTDAGVGIFQSNADGVVLSYKKISSQRFRLDDNESVITALKWRIGTVVLLTAKL